MLVASVSAVEGAARAATTGWQGGPYHWRQLWTRGRYRGKTWICEDWMVWRAWIGHILPPLVYHCSPRIIVSL